jgi:hypothetical protein
MSACWHALSTVARTEYGDNNFQEKNIIKLLALTTNSFADVPHSDKKKTDDLILMILIIELSHHYIHSSHSLRKQNTREKKRAPTFTLDLK